MHFEILFLLIGCVFGFLAALAAFFITYEEYRKHGFSRSRLLRESFAAAFFAFAIFFGLALILGLILPKLV